MAASQQCTLPFYYYTSEPEWPCYGAPRALSHQGKQVPAAPIRYRYALSRVLVLVLPLLIVGLVAAAVVAATSSSRRQEYHGTRLDNDEKDFTEEDTSLLIGSGGLSREAPAETFKPRRLVDTGGKHIAANATETPEITVNTPARYHGDIEFEPPRRPGETTGNLSPFFHTTSSATDKSSPPTPPKPSAGLGDVMRASIQDLLSAMEAASLTPSHRKQIVPQSPSIIKPLHGETPDAGMTASRESTKGYKEGLDLKEEPDFRNEHEEPPGRRQLAPARRSHGAATLLRGAGGRGHALAGVPSAARPRGEASRVRDTRSTAAV
ncbi:uncharacterized protein [Dermacentor albipictus]|uniref:uncharacterized protein isoform X8 n=1 Tax=Dermacentor albipictus TaxID=60249 RepID=UPI0038FC5444